MGSAPVAGSTSPSSGTPVAFSCVINATSMPLATMPRVSFPLDLSKVPASISHLTFTNQEDVNGNHGDNFAIFLSDGIWPPSLLGLEVGQDSIGDMGRALWVPPYVINAFALRSSTVGVGTSSTLKLCGMRPPTVSTTSGAGSSLMTLYLPVSAHSIEMNVDATAVTWLIPANQILLGVITKCGGNEIVSAMTCSDATPHVRMRGYSAMCPPDIPDAPVVRAILTQNLKPRLPINDDSLTLASCSGFLPLFELSTPWLNTAPSIEKLTLSNINASSIHVITGAEVKLSVVNELCLVIAAGGEGVPFSNHSFRPATQKEVVVFSSSSTTTSTGGKVSITAPEKYLTRPISVGTKTRLTLTSRNIIPINFTIAPDAFVTVSHLSDVLEFNTPCGDTNSDTPSILNVTTTIGLNGAKDSLIIWGGVGASVWIQGASGDTSSMCDYISRRCRGATCKTLPSIPASSISAGKGILPLLHPSEGAYTPAVRPFDAQAFVMGSNSTSTIGVGGAGNIPGTNQLHRSFLLHSAGGVSAWGFIAPSGLLNLSFIVDGSLATRPSFQYAPQTPSSVSQLLEGLPEFRLPSSPLASNALHTFPSFAETIFRSFPNGSVSSFRLVWNNSDLQYSLVRSGEFMMKVTSVLDVGIRALDIMRSIAGDVVHAALTETGVYINGDKVHSFDPIIGCTRASIDLCNPTSIAFANMAGSAVFVVDDNSIKSIVAGVPSATITEVATGLQGTGSGSLKHVHLPPPGVEDGSHTLAYAYNTSISALQFNIIRDPPINEDWGSSTTYGVTIRFPTAYADLAMFTNTETVAFIPDPLQRFRVAFTASSKHAPNVVSVLVALGSIPLESDLGSSDTFEQEVVCARSFGYSTASTITVLSESEILKTDAPRATRRLVDLTNPLEVVYMSESDIWKSSIDSTTNAFEPATYNVHIPTIMSPSQSFAYNGVRLFISHQEDVLFFARANLLFGQGPFGHGLIASVNVFPGSWSAFQFTLLVVYNHDPNRTVYLYYSRYSSTIAPPIAIPLVGALTEATATLSTIQKSSGDVIVMYLIENTGTVKVQVYTTVSDGSGWKGSVDLGDIEGIPEATENGGNPFTWMAESGRRSDALQEEYVLRTEGGSIYVLDCLRKTLRSVIKSGGDAPPIFPTYAIPTPRHLSRVDKYSIPSFRNLDGSNRMMLRQGPTLYQISCLFTPMYSLRTSIASLSSSSSSNVVVDGGMSVMRMSSKTTTTTNVSEALRLGSPAAINSQYVFPPPPPGEGGVIVGSLGGGGMPRGLWCENATTNASLISFLSTLTPENVTLQPLAVPLHDQGTQMNPHFAMSANNQFYIISVDLRTHVASVVCSYQAGDGIQGFYQIRMGPTGVRFYVLGDSGTSIYSLDYDTLEATLAPQWISSLPEIMNSIVPGTTHNHAFVCNHPLSSGEACYKVYLSAMAGTAAYGKIRVLGQIGRGTLYLNASGSPVFEEEANSPIAANQNEGICRECRNPQILTPSPTYARTGDKFDANFNAARGVLEVVLLCSCDAGDVAYSITIIPHTSSLNIQLFASTHQALTPTSNNQRGTAWDPLTGGALFWNSALGSLVFAPCGGVPHMGTTRSTPSSVTPRTCTQCSDSMQQTSCTLPNYNVRNDRFMFAYAQPGADSTSGAMCVVKYGLGDGHEIIRFYDGTVITRSLSYDFMSLQPLSANITHSVFVTAIEGRTNAIVVVPCNSSMPTMLIQDVGGPSQLQALDADTTAGIVWRIGCEDRASGEFFPVIRRTVVPVNHITSDVWTVNTNTLPLQYVGPIALVMNDFCSHNHVRFVASQDPVSGIIEVVVSNPSGTSPYYFTTSPTSLNSYLIARTPIGNSVDIAKSGSVYRYHYAPQWRETYSTDGSPSPSTAAVLGTTPLMKFMSSASLRVAHINTFYRDGASIPEVFDSSGLMDFVTTDNVAGEVGVANVPTFTFYRANTTVVTFSAGEATTCARCHVFMDAYYHSTPIGGTGPSASSPRQRLMLFSSATQEVWLQQAGPVHSAPNYQALVYLEVELKVPMSGFAAGVYSLAEPSSTTLSSFGVMVPIRDTMTPSWLLTVGSNVFRIALNPSMSSAPKKAVEYIQVGTITSMATNSKITQVNIIKNNDQNEWHITFYTSLGMSYTYTHTAYSWTPLFIHNFNSGTWTTFDSATLSPVTTPHWAVPEVRIDADGCFISPLLAAPLPFPSYCPNSSSTSTGLKVTSFIAHNNGVDANGITTALYILLLTSGQLIRMDTGAGTMLSIGGQNLPGTNGFYNGARLMYRSGISPTDNRNSLVIALEWQRLDILVSKGLSATLHVVCPNAAILDNAEPDRQYSITNPEEVFYQQLSTAFTCDESSSHPLIDTKHVIGNLSPGDRLLGVDAHGEAAYVLTGDGKIEYRGQNEVLFVRYMATSGTSIQKCPVVVVDDFVISIIMTSKTIKLVEQLKFHLVVTTFDRHGAAMPITTMLESNIGDPSTTTSQADFTISAMRSSTLKNGNYLYYIAYSDRTNPKVIITKYNLVEIMRTVAGPRTPVGAPEAIYSSIPPSEPTWFAKLAEQNDMAPGSTLPFESTAIGPVVSMAFVRNSKSDTSNPDTDDAFSILIIHENIAPDYNRIRHVYLDDTNAAAALPVRTAFFMKGASRLATPLTMAPISGKVLPSNVPSSIRIPLGLVVSESFYVLSVVNGDKSGSYSMMSTDISSNKGYLVGSANGALYKSKNNGTGNIAPITMWSCFEEHPLYLFLSHATFIQPIFPRYAPMRFWRSCTSLGANKFDCAFEGNNIGGQLNLTAFPVSGQWSFNKITIAGKSASLPAAFNNHTIPAGGATFQAQANALLISDATFEDGAHFSAQNVTDITLKNVVFKGSNSGIRMSSFNNITAPVKFIVVTSPTANGGRGGGCPNLFDEALDLNNPFMRNSDFNIDCPGSNVFIKCNPEAFDAPTTGDFSVYPNIKFNGGGIGIGYGGMYPCHCPPTKEINLSATQLCAGTTTTTNATTNSSSSSSSSMDTNSASSSVSDVSNNTTAITISTTTTTTTSPPTAPPTTGAPAALSCEHTVFSYRFISGVSKTVSSSANNESVSQEEGEELAGSQIHTKGPSVADLAKGESTIEIYTDIPATMTLLKQKGLVPTKRLVQEGKQLLAEGVLHLSALPPTSTPSTIVRIVSGGSGGNPTRVVRVIAGHRKVPLEEAHNMLNTSPSANTTTTSNTTTTVRTLIITIAGAGTAAVSEDLKVVLQIDSGVFGCPYYVKPSSSSAPEGTAAGAPTTTPTSPPTNAARQFSVHEVNTYSNISTRYDGSNPTITVTFTKYVSPLPIEVKQTAQTTSMISRALSGIGAAPASAAATGRATILVQLATCDYSHYAPLELMQSPTAMGFGTPLAYYYRGGVIGNTLLLLALFTGLFFVALFLFFAAKQYRSMGFKNGYLAALFRLHFPAFLVVPYLTLLPGLVMSTVALLWHGNGDATDICIGLFGFVITIGTPASLMAPVFLNFQCEFVEIGYFDQEDAFLSFFTGTWHWETIEDENGDPIDATFKTRMGIIFKDYAKRAWWFMMIEVILTYLASILDGVRPSNQSYCVIVAWLFMIISVVMLVAVVVMRPFIALFENIYGVANNALVAVGAVFLVVAMHIDDEEQSANVAAVAEMMGFTAVFLSLGKISLDILVNGYILFRDTIRKNTAIDSAKYVDVTDSRQAKTLTRKELRGIEPTAVSTKSAATTEVTTTSTKTAPLLHLENTHDLAISQESNESSNALFDDEDDLSDMELNDVPLAVEMGTSQVSGDMQPHSSTSLSGSLDHSNRRPSTAASDLDSLLGSPHPPVVAGNSDDDLL